MSTVTSGAISQDNAGHVVKVETIQYLDRRTHHSFERLPAIAAFEIER